MANSTRKGTQRQLRSDVDFCPQDWADTARDDGPNGESRSTAETPNLWHGGAQRECWTGCGPTESVSWECPFAAPGRPALRVRRLPRRRTSLHCSRSLEGAAARFISASSQYVTD